MWFDHRKNFVDWFRTHQLAHMLTSSSAIHRSLMPLDRWIIRFTHKKTTAKFIEHVPDQSWTKAAPSVSITSQIGRNWNRSTEIWTISHGAKKPLTLQAVHGVLDYVVDSSKKSKHIQRSVSAVKNTWNWNVLHKIPRTNSGTLSGRKHRNIAQWSVNDTRCSVYGAHSQQQRIEKAIKFNNVVRIH